MANRTRLDITRLLALRGTRKILLSMEKTGKMKYSEIVKVVGYSTTTTRSLKSMERFGVVKREILNEPYRPVAYSLTEKGKKLATLLKELENL
jgi:DNA-binding HxlR family transcriptional regulator